MSSSPPTKQVRLSIACNACRARKVKCDANYPKCGHCSYRNEDCRTTRSRNPTIEIRREWIEWAPSTPTEYKNNNHAGSLRGHGDAHGRSYQVSSQARSTQVRDAGPPADGQDSISPVHQTHDVSYNIDPSTNRVKMLGTSSAQVLAHSLDRFFTYANLEPVLPMFQYGMVHAEEMQVAFLSQLPELPGPTELESYFRAFDATIGQLYPLFKNFTTTIDKFRGLTNLQDVKPEDVPLLVSLYLIISIGQDQYSGNFTPGGESYLKAAMSLLGYVVITPYVNSIKCLLLFTLVYRGRNKDGLGWQTLGMAIRIAHTLGLHQVSHSAVNDGTKHEVAIWAMCVSLEKTMQLECGRPSSIQRSDIPKDLDIINLDCQSDGLRWLVRLAQIQHDISELIYGYKAGTKTAQEILRDTLALDQRLLSLATEMPASIRPGSALLCSDEELTTAAYISIQYDLALIALHRAALVAPREAFRAEVEKHCSENLSRVRLGQGEDICLNSARSIARLTVELADKRPGSRIFTAGSPLLACLVLAIALMKNAFSQMQMADLELLRICTESTTEHLLGSGHDVRFSNGMTSIYRQVSCKVVRESTTHRNNRDSFERTLVKASDSTRVASQESPNHLHEELRGSESSTWTVGSTTSGRKSHSENHPEQIDQQGVYANGIYHDTGLAPFDGLDLEKLFDFLVQPDGYEYDSIIR